MEVRHVLGISGGKDSAVVAGLLVKALGKENVIGITLPCHSKESDKKDAIAVANKLERVVKVLRFSLLKAFLRIVVIVIRPTFLP